MNKTYLRSLLRSPLRPPASGLSVSALVSAWLMMSRAPRLVARGDEKAHAKDFDLGGAGASLGK